MPANRSRTTRWRTCLQQIHERGGAIEIAIARDYAAGEAGSHLLWRVRILALADQWIDVEAPAALGRTIDFERGIDLVAFMNVGQNRWKFKTKVAGGGNGGLRLAAPQTVDRCQRRIHDRVEAPAVVFPNVELWPLLDPASVVLAERANELAAHDAARRGTAAGEVLLPEVGPRFAGQLINIGGGGVGVRIPPEHAAALSRHRVFWMRITLAPDLAAPVCATSKLIHSHMQSDQHVYAGMAFDFSFNAGHQRFVVDQISRFIAAQQKAQRAARTAAA